MGDQPSKTAYGCRVWTRGRVLHREDGPAVERDNGGKSWWRDGVRDRADGPAVESRVRVNYHDGRWTGTERPPPARLTPLKGSRMIPDLES